MVDGFRSFAVLVEPTGSLDVVQDDPSDNKFIECALAAGAEYVVSGDPHLLRIGHYEEIQILRPAEFRLLIEDDQGERTVDEALAQAACYPGAMAWCALHRTQSQAAANRWQTDRGRTCAMKYDHIVLARDRPARLSRPA